MIESDIKNITFELKLPLKNRNYCRKNQLMKKT